MLIFYSTGYENFKTKASRFNTVMKPT